MKYKKSKLLLLGCLLLAVSQMCSAGIIAYTDRISWENALTGSIVEESFNGISKYDFSLGSNSAGLLDINISGDSHGSNRIEDIANSSLDIDGSNYYLGNVRNGSPSTYSELAFGTDIYTFGADWVGVVGYGNLVATIGSVDINFTDYFSGKYDAGFLGFISDESFSSIFFSTESVTTNEAFGMDNVAFSVSSVPEPGSLLLMLVPLGILIARRNRLNNLHT